jgi:hypothetical protein
MDTVSVRLDGSECCFHIRYGQMHAGNEIRGRGVPASQSVEIERPHGKAKVQGKPSPTDRPRNLCIDVELASGNYKGWRLRAVSGHRVPNTKTSTKAAMAMNP